MAQPDRPLQPVASALLIALGTAIIIADRVERAPPFYFWIAVGLIGVGTIALTPWGRSLR